MNIAAVMAPLAGDTASVMRTRVRLRTLVIIRWLAIAGQIFTLFLVNFGFGFALPLNATMAAIGASAVLNLGLTLYRPAARLGYRGATVLLAWDLVQLGTLLYFTGGLTNPFAFLMVAPVVISATVLPRASTIALCGLGITCASALAFWYEPLPWPGGGLAFPLLYVAGLWVAVVVGLLFIAVYVGSIAAESQKMSDALAASQAALAREQRLSALGALAAAAAHELGTPLGTIAVIARDLARDLPKNSALAEDANLLLAETARCRDILARLATRPEAEEGTPFSLLPLTALVEAAAAAHRRERILQDFSSASGDGTAEPQVARKPEIIYGLGALVENATQFARSRVALRTVWTKSEVEITVADDGPGFPLVILDRLGEPYLSTRAAEGEHMGLGVFIAATLLGRTGANLAFANRPEGGASVRVRWPRERLDRTGAAP
jgi:two-component system, sensor histidine kinase RegB